MTTIGPLNFSNQGENSVPHTTKTDKTNRSIFEKSDTDGIVNDEDFVNNKEIGKKIKSMGYFGSSWDDVRSVIVSFFNKSDKQFDGKLNVLNENFQNINNQIIVKGIDFTKSSDEISNQLQAKGAKIIKDSDGFVAEFRNKDGQLVQTISIAEATRGASNVSITNFNTNGQKISSVTYNNFESQFVLNIVQEYNYDENGNEINGTRYTPPRHGVKYAKENGEQVKVNIVEIEPTPNGRLPYKPVSETKASYNEKGKKIQ